MEFFKVPDPGSIKEFKIINDRIIVTMHENYKGEKTIYRTFQKKLLRELTYLAAGTAIIGGVSYAIVCNRLKNADETSNEFFEKICMTNRESWQKD